MFKSLMTLPSKLIKYPGIKYGAPELMFEPHESIHKPVVLIFGWLGASERHLSKYTKLYQDKGTSNFLFLSERRIQMLPQALRKILSRILLKMVLIFTPLFLF